MLSGHNDLIHDMCWSHSDNYLISSSADGIVKMWNLNTKETESSDRLNYQDNDYMFFMCDIKHPSFVYGAQIHPSSDDNNLYIATICFDSKVRIYGVRIILDSGVDIEVCEPVLFQTISINDKPN